MSVGLLFRKPDSVTPASGCHLSWFHVATKLNRPTPRQWTGDPLQPVYLAFQHIGFTPAISHLIAA